MARVFDICGKRPLVGNNVSHAHNKTKKVSYLNLQSVRHQENGQVRRIKACTQCIKSGKVIKPSPRP